jgi:SEC-C motif-containing protein
LVSEVTSLPTALPKPQSGQPCPCGSGGNYENCCEPILTGRTTASTAEKLMRSRFTAHVALDYPYLHRTHRPTAHLPYVEEKADLAPMRWTRLVVHSHEPGKTADTAFVEFSAFFADESGEHVIQEKSEFLRLDGQWLYARAVRSGPAPFKSVAPKAGRNDPCPCGSGKKYKHCCLAKG